ncbi:hypothetical protein C4553_01055 [Candidatus Parcubacteria bacterium]|nr:MAG: hypothetical protein C4553_01055 [Candidatus Parcubacteria bacterium]
MSELKASDWNTVVVGKWNPAILSPKGISTLLFNKDATEPIEVMVSLEQMGPTKVRIDGIGVTVDYDRLIIDAAEQKWESLAKTREYACRAIATLERTPLSAAGFNVRYELKDYPESFITLLKPPLDDVISDNNQEILERETRRSLKWKEGSINLQISRKEETYSIILNFDRTSDDCEKLKNWLSIPIGEVREITATIISSILQLCEKGEI